MNHGLGECTRCGIGLNCSWLELSQANPQGLTTAEESLLTPVVLRGFIADIVGSSTRFEKFSVWKCHAKACVGGNAIERGGKCAAGREGTACGRCKTRHREVERYGECKRCAREDASNILASAVFVAGFLLLGALLVVHRAAVTDTVQGNWENGQAIRAAAKILFRYFVQLSIVSDFDIAWPALNLQLLTWPKFLRLDVFHLVDARCLFDPSLHNTMWIHWIMPVGVAALTFLAGGLNNSLALLSKAFSRISGAALLELLGGLYGIFIGTIVKQCFLPFECVRHPNGKLSVAARPDVLCYEGQHLALVPIAALFVGVYVLLYFSFVVYVSRQVPTWTRSEATEMRFGFVYADFRSGSYWWGPAVVLKELLCAGTVAFSPGDGGNQIVLMTFFTTAYLMSTLYFQPYPDIFQNYLDGLVHAGVIVQTVFSLNFAVQEGSQASSGDDFCTDFCTSLHISHDFCHSCASLWLLALQLTFTVLPGVLTLVIVLKTVSGRFARQFSDKREEVDRFLQDARSNAPDRGWDFMKESLMKYKFDEVEMSAMHETVSALAVRYDGDSGIRRRVGTVVGRRTLVAEEERADSVAPARELRPLGVHRDRSQGHDTTEEVVAERESLSPTIGL
jgi:hypothetical protein